ncbi:hypothetical protein A2154_00570 [Candidatus Gottesmanbacteria bacterium RBG_16_43_7]|uniref:Phosphoribosyltransferase domain-containing protein n=1 Tax=Candidatus Gottesmanbacteria bacterium RBG_16_43_7 TaxID=1798373 RepID=A0A1F5Z813_9BACT|nr:MAG: hypothetical protein A2154_00570 [Candidatus Gottesmanbacteria bacterium RBG_16_43_7]
MASQYFPVSWLLYHTLALKLAATIRSHNLTFDEIVAIARGGLTLGHIMSDFLNLPVCTFTIQSYKDIRDQGLVEITEPMKKPIKGKHILLVDDIADSGKTLSRAKAYLTQLKPKSVTIMTMFYKPASIVIPDFYAKKTDKWVIFPSEVAETIRSITRLMEKGGKSKAQIQNMLISLGFSKDQIIYVRKHHLKAL